MTELADWLTERKIDEVECLVPDINGIARGKILPAAKFIKSVQDDSLRLPESIFIQTVTGEYSENADYEDIASDQDPDIYLRPDPETIRVVPWYQEPTAQVICDAFDGDGKPVEVSARQVLRRVLALYQAKGWKPVVAPELEFFLVQINTDPDLPLLPPVGRSGRAETGRQSYGIDATNEFDPIFEDVYDFCEAQEIDIDTLTHEAGAAQMEINFNHGDALPLADQAGSSMHIHQSVMESDGTRNIFADKLGRDSALFRSHVAGLQRYLPQVMPLLAPNVNSFRRLRPYSDAPINVQWGVDNRSVGLRVPISDGPARRIENRLAGADANPYLAIAASLACGYLGMIERMKPTKQIETSAYRLPHTLPRTLYDALHRFNGAKKMRPVLGERFMRAMTLVKQSELEAYQGVISSWEREHLLLNV